MRQCGAAAHRAARTGCVGTDNRGVLTCANVEAISSVLVFWFFVESQAACSVL